METGMNSALGWLSGLAEGAGSAAAPGTCADHERICTTLACLAAKSVGFEEELLSHLAAIQELSRREKRARDVQSRAVFAKLGSIEERVEKMSNGGLRDSVLDVIPVILQNAGLVGVENAKGRWAVITGIISAIAAIGGGVLGWIVTRLP